MPLHNLAASLGGEPSHVAPPPGANSAQAVIEHLYSQINILSNELNAVRASQAASGQQPASYAPQQQSRPPMPRIPSPTIFDGRSNTLDDWLTEMERQRDWYRFATETEGVQFATAFLKGAAYEWYHQLDLASKKPQTWNELAEGLRTRFQPINRAEIARGQLRALTQGKRSVHEYVDAFNRLLVHVPTMAEDDRIFHFMHGLNPSIAAQVRVSVTSKVLQDIIGAAVRIGGLGEYGSAAAAASFAHSAASSSSSSSSQKSVMMELDAITRGVEGLEPETSFGGNDATSSTTGATGSDAPITRAELMQALNAIRENRYAGKPHNRGPARPANGQEGRRPFPRIPHLSEIQVKAYLDEGKCFGCGSKDHQSRQCPKRKVDNNGKVSWSSN